MMSKTIEAMSKGKNFGFIELDFGYNIAPGWPGSQPLKN
jgi:hypothetical protein